MRRSDNKVQCMIMYVIRDRDMLGVVKPISSSVTRGKRISSERLKNVPMT